MRRHKRRQEGDAMHPNEYLAQRGQAHTYLIQREAAKYRRCSERTLERERRYGTGPPFIRAGRRILYPLEDLENWLAARKFTSTAAADAARKAGS